MMYHFEPLYRPLIWGSENWILSAMPERISVCRETGETITEMVSRMREHLVGRHVYARCGNLFPLLIKFIDAHDDLSVQVHPSDEIANRHGEPFGKTEMWYALPSEPGAQLYCGLKYPLTPEEYKRKVEDKTLMDALAKYDVHDGDFFFIPAGCIHAICSGCQVCEIQQTSDTTYRIYDYDRRDAEGKPRQLHTELAAECINYADYGRDAKVTDEQLRASGNSNLVSCDYFTTNVLRVSRPLTRDYSAYDSFAVIICLDGEGTIDGQPLHAGELVLIPADAKPVTFDGSFRALEVYVDR